MLSRRFGHRAPLLWIALPLMAGLSCGRSWEPAARPCLGAALAAAVLGCAAAARHPRLWAVFVAGTLLLGGAASYSLHRGRLADWERRPAREAKLELRIDRPYPQADPRKADGLAVITGGEPHLRALVGQRLFYSIRLGKKQAAPQRGASVSCLGLLSPVPRHPPEGSFAAALDDLGLNFQLLRGRLGVPGRPAPPYRRFCEGLAAAMRRILTRGLERHPALAGIYRAMMLGLKKDLGPSERDRFLESGTLHLFAINGLHIGVAAISLHALFALARCPRPLASALVLAVLWLDVDTTGASPSAVRAFLMIAAAEAALAFRLPGNPLAALAVSTLPALLFDPMDYFSASFRMSYGVVAVLLTLGLPLGARLREKHPPYRHLPEPSRTPFQHGRAWLQERALEAFGMGLAAALVGAVAGIGYFRIFAPGGLAANLALAPLASLVIMAGCGSLAAGCARLHGLSLLCNRAAGLCIAAIERMALAETRIPGTWTGARYRAAWIGPAALGLLVACCLFGYACRWRKARGGFWPPFAVVGLTLIFGVRYGP